MLIDNVEAFRTYCLQKKGVTEEFPFDETTLTFKVVGKLFALTSLNEETFRINLKCNPDWALELRDEYLLKKLIDHSYDLVVKRLTKKQQLALVKIDKNNE